MSVRDERDDLWRPVGFDGWTPTPGIASDGDLRRSTVKHQRARVRIEISYHELIRAENEMRLLFSLQTPVRILDLSPRGYFTLAVAKTEAEAGDGPIKCRVTVSPSYAKKKLRANIPRSCLANPRWIRFQGRNGTYDETEGLWVDDIRTNGAPSLDSWSRRLPAPRTARD